jgi:putative peptidoglycan lipid II flippase
MLPAIILMGGANLVTAALHVYRRFARPALASAMNNLVFIAVLLGLPQAWAVGRAAWGVTLGAASALLVQLPLLWTFRPHLRDTKVTEGSQGEPHPTIRDLVRLAGPLTVGYSVHHAILFVDRAMASTLGAGSVATLNYGYRLALVVGQLSGLAVSTAVFPGMAEQADRKDDAGLRASLAGALGLVWAIAAPACAGLVLLRVPVVQVLFERGAFDQEATVAVSGVLRWYAPAVLADALCMPLWRVIYAWRSGRTVLAVNGLQTLIRLTGNLALMPSFGYDGLALSAAIGLSVQLLVLLWIVRRRLGNFLGPAWWRRVLHVIAATGCALVVAGLLHGRLSATPALVDLIVSGAAGSLAYLLAFRFLEKSSWRSRI